MILKWSVSCDSQARTNVQLTTQLIEMIDNANNMVVLKMWEPLLALLASPEPEIVANAAWIMGTAVQNNLKAQAAVRLLLAHIPSRVSVAIHVLKARELSGRCLAAPPPSPR